MTQGIGTSASRPHHFPLRKPPGILCVSSAVRMAGLHLVIRMSKFRAPYPVRKRGIFYLQKRIPQQLTGHYGRTFVRKSLNRWLRKHVPSGCVVHSFRHSMRDRLRAVGCPFEMIDQVGGWTTSGVGQQYGEGFTLKNIQRFFKQIE